MTAPRAALGAQAARKKNTSASLASIELGRDRKAAAKAATSAASANDQVAKIDFLSLASVTTDPGYASDIGVKPGTKVRFVGFTVRSSKPGRFQIARFLISCCAADALPVFIEVKAGAGKFLRTMPGWISPADSRRSRRNSSSRLSR